jgi:hypothetical protein
LTKTVGDQPAGRRRGAPVEGSDMAWQTPSSEGAEVAVVCGFMGCGHLVAAPRLCGGRRCPGNAIDGGTLVDVACHEADKDVEADPIDEPGSVLVATDPPLTLAAQHGTLWDPQAPPAVLVGRTEEMQLARAATRGWQTRQMTAPLLITGPSGIGRHSLAHHILRSHDGSVVVQSVHVNDGADPAASMRNELVPLAHPPLTRWLWKIRYTRSGVTAEVEGRAPAPNDLSTLVFRAARRQDRRGKTLVLHGRDYQLHHQLHDGIARGLLRCRDEGIPAGMIVTGTDEQLYPRGDDGEAAPAFPRELKSQTLSLQRLTPDAAKEVLTGPAAAVGVDFGDKAAEILARHAFQHPELIAKYGEAVWEEATSTPIDPQFARAVAERVDMAARQGHLNELQAMAADERAMLRQISTWTVATSMVVLDAQRKPVESKIATLRRLVDRGLIEETHAGEFRVASPTMARTLQWMNDQNRSPY